MQLAARPALRRTFAALAAWRCLAFPGDAVAQPTPGTPPAEPAAAPEAPAEEAYAIHAQLTVVDQYHPGFRSAFFGPNSLSSGQRTDETVSQTSYFGLRPWDGAEAWVNPEIIQGFGFNRTLGLAGFSNGEAFKVGSDVPYVRLQRVFLRQTIDLGGDVEAVEADQNQLAGNRTADRLVLTAGKFALTDVFDTNRYAHDPRNDFMNWTVWDLGAWDFAADAWGYTYGAAAEWYRDWWTLRAGAFQLSTLPNVKALDTKPFDQWEAVVEAEERHELGGQPGKARLLGYVNFARMAKLTDFVRVEEATGVPPPLPTLRSNHKRPGIGLNLEQQILPDLGAFARMSYASGNYETFDFTDVDRSLSGGLSLTGTRWGRPDDTVGLAGVVNDISNARRAFLNAGGLGILVGDGMLPHAGPEKIIEAYYSLSLVSFAKLTFDYQFVDNPAYNRDRGPVSILGLRVHAQF